MSKNNKIKPFEIYEHENNLYSVCLDQSDYCYDWLNEKKTKSSRNGDGYCYEDLFIDYLDENFAELSQKLNFDSESGMFCVYCQNKEDADKVAHELSLLYNNETKMINLIKNTKKLYDYVFDISI